jgi:hypothetical protein
LETALTRRRLRQVKRASLSTPNGTRADPRARCPLTNGRASAAQTARMDEPTHANESAFWDQVAEWLLGTPTSDHGPMSQEAIQAILRHQEDNPDSH